MDRANRHYDADGRLHVARSNICMATVSPYRGSEIPGWDDLGLDPDKTYNLFRPPEELEKAVETANNIPLLIEHVPVSADDPQHELVIGSTGTDAAWDAPYITNSLVIWDRQGIDGVESREQVELSPAYRYVAVKKSGSYQGLTYDLAMTNIVFNHIASVEAGRQGPTVVVADSNTGMQPMALKSRKALMVSGAVRAFLAPKLAQDQKVDLTPILGDVTRKNFKAKAPAIVTAITAACAGKLAADASLADLPGLIDTFTQAAPEEGAADEDEIDDDDNEMPPAEDDGDDLGARIGAALKGKVDDETMAAIMAMCGSGAADEDDDDAGEQDGGDPTKKDAPAMDAKTIERRAVRRVAAIAAAREAVEPVVGKVSHALDSAAAIYGLAFDHLGIEYKSVSPSAYPVMLQLAMDAKAPKPVIALDAAGADAAASFAKSFPDAAPLIRS